MSVMNEHQTADEPEEASFLRKALADVEKAERFQRIRQIAITLMVLSGFIWWAIKKPGPEWGLEGKIVLIVGLIVGAATAKIMALIKKNTRTILQAVAKSKRL